VGAGTLIDKHLDFTGDEIFDDDVQYKISRQTEEYFSIVRRKAA